MTEVDIEIEVLIALIKSKPELWDKTSEIYKDRNATKKAWEEVCIALYKNFLALEEKAQSTFLKEVMRRWCNVRDSFAKYCRKEREAKSGVREKNKKLKKYIYHNQMSFIKKLYDAENGEENDTDERDDDAKRIDTETFIEKVYPRTRSQDTVAVPDTGGEDNLTPAEAASTSQLSDMVSNKRKQLGESEVRKKVYPRSRRKDTVVVSDAGGEDNLTSAETASTTSQLSDSFSQKRKHLDESEMRTSKILDGETSDRHLSFFRGIIPSLEELNEQEVLKFQMGVLQVISNINDQRHRASHAQPPAQCISFPSQPGPSAYLPTIATPYPPGQPIFPTFLSAVCTRCNNESTPRETSSKPVD